MSKEGQTRGLGGKRHRTERRKELLVKEFGSCKGEQGGWQVQRGKKPSESFTEKEGSNQDSRTILYRCVQGKYPVAWSNPFLIPRAALEILATLCLIRCQEPYTSSEGPGHLRIRRYIGLKSSDAYAVLGMLKTKCYHTVVVKSRYT
ncbi:hypothetical protein VNO77_33316 [Canavalia gladiata]|uniref:Uncharacterized protein n=1 Tax=Canavalia gladiata TaxID=3824 RepID=A0AAN9KEH8_CANGL